MGYDRLNIPGVNHSMIATEDQLEIPWHFSDKILKFPDDNLINTSLEPPLTAIHSSHNTSLLGDCLKWLIIF